MLCVNGINAVMMAAFFGDNMKLKYLGSRSSLGDWTLKDLKPMVPVFLTVDGPEVTEMYSQYKVKSGSDYTTKGVIHILGRSSSRRAFSDMLVPNSATLTLTFVDMVGGVIIHAFTVE